MARVINTVAGRSVSTVAVPQSINITTPPNKTSYAFGESFDPTGMQLSITYSNGAILEATSFTYFPEGALSPDNTEIVVSYTEGSVTVTTTQNVSVGRAVLSVPSLIGSLTYSGSEQMPTWSEYDASIISTSGDLSGTNAGEYITTFSILNTANYYWDDGTVEDKNVTWVINKAACAVSIDKDNITLSDVGTSDTIVVTRDGNGTISAESSNTSAVTVSVEGNIITVTSVEGGSSTITISVAESDNYLASDPITCSVFCDIASSLNSYSWEKIAEIAAAGEAANYFSIGDCKQIVLNGTVGTITLSNYVTYVYIIDFDHDGNTGTIDFGTFKDDIISGNDRCLADDGYGSKYSDGSRHFSINHWGQADYGGWKGCDLRYDILGSTDVPPKSYGSIPASGRVGYDATGICATNPKYGTLMAALPSDLRAVMKPMTIMTDNTGGKTHNSTHVKSSIDYLPLMSTYEIFGNTGSANSYEGSKQTRYTYYANGNSRVKSGHSTGDDVKYWTRSLAGSTSSDTSVVTWCAVSATGAIGGGGSISYSYGLAPIFRI